MALSKFKAPALPYPDKEYSPRTMLELVRAIQLYFSQLDSSTPNYASTYTADRYYLGSTSGPFWTSGDGDPENVLTAPAGSIYSRTDGNGTKTLYVKTTVSGNTGWKHLS